MKALRWILFCLVAFGLGTGVAFAMHPPTVGIPKSDAADLAGDLSAIKKYAAIGHCDAVRGRVSSASRTIQDLPSSVNATTSSKLMTAVEQVRTAALAECQRVANANEPEASPTTPATTPEASPTTPEATATPEITPEPTATPDPNTQPTSPSGGAGLPDDGADQNSQGGDSSSGGGGITLPNGVQVPSVNEIRQKVHDAEKQARQQLKDAWKH